MPGFSVVNLLQVEDSVGDRAPGIEGRFGRKHLDSRDLGVSLFRYESNLRSPFAHSHREQEEAYVVVSGSGRVLLDGELQELGQWDVLRVAPEVVRAFEAGPDGLELIAIGGPKPEDGDGVLGGGAWPDAAEAAGQLSPSPGGDCARSAAPSALPADSPSPLPISTNDSIAMSGSMWFSLRNACTLRPECFSTAAIISRLIVR